MFEMKAKTYSINVAIFQKKSKKCFENKLSIF